MSNLDTIPWELLTLICSYLPPKFVCSSFILVCKKFYVLLGRQEYWHSRLMKIDPTFSFPDSTISTPSFRWDRTCAIIESEQKRWKNQEKHFRQFTLSDGHIATVDAVHLMQDGRLCISGSHDRIVCAWDLSQLLNSTDASGDTSNICRKCAQCKGHEGWIWTIASSDDVVYTGSWDQKILQWQLTQTGLCQVSAINCSSAVLCVVAERNFIVASTFDRHVHLFDIREPNYRTTRLSYHTRSVLGLATDPDERYIYSCSEDKSVVCFDRRAASVLHRLRMDDYGVAVSNGDGQLWVASRTGTLHLLDNDLNELTTYNTGGGKIITDIKHNVGAIVSACYNEQNHAGSCRVSTSGLQPHTVADIGCVDQHPTKLDFKYGILACGYVDANIRIWLPREE